MVQCGTWYRVEHGTVWVMVQCGTWYSMEHGTVWNVVWCGTWYRVEHGTVWDMVQYGTWYIVGHRLVQWKISNPAPYTNTHCIKTHHQPRQTWNSCWPLKSTWAHTNKGCLEPASADVYDFKRPVLYIVAPTQPVHSKARFTSNLSVPHVTRCA